MGRSSPHRHRVRPTRQEGSLRCLRPAGFAGGQSPCHSFLPRTHRDVRCHLRRLGLAHSVPRIRRAGDRRPLHPRADPGNAGDARGRRCTGTHETTVGRSPAFTPGGAAPRCRCRGGGRGDHLRQDDLRPRLDHHRPWVHPIGLPARDHPRTGRAGARPTLRCGSRHQDRRATRRAVDARTRARRPAADVRADPHRLAHLGDHRHGARHRAARDILLGAGRHPRAGLPHARALHRHLVVVSDLDGDLRRHRPDGEPVPPQPRRLDLAGRRARDRIRADLPDLHDRAAQTLTDHHRARRTTPPGRRPTPPDTNGRP